MNPDASVARLYRRLLAAIFVIAWLSLGAQVQVLFGSHGLLPVRELLDSVRAQGGAWRFPTWLWISPSDAALTIGVIAGLACATAALLGVRVRLMLGLSTALYLGYTVAGQTFLSFQWDNLLLECGAFAVLLRRDRRDPWVYLLFRLILFKLYFESGIAKAQSHLGDWLDGSAMTYYYETAPLPTALAWWAHALPAWWHHFESWATLALELVVPFGIFAPRRVRWVVLGLLTGFQLLNAATANYGFFVWLALALHLFLVDDRDLARAGAWIRARLGRPPAVGIAVAVDRAAPPPSSNPWRRRALPIAVLSLFSAISLVEGLATFSAPAAALLSPLEPLRELYLPLRLINTYHLFGHITRARIEPELQTLDGGAWTAQPLRHKAGEPSRAPGFVAPHQPRVDFQLWFYGLGYRSGMPRYVARLLERLCHDPDAVAGLFERPLPPHPSAVRIAFFAHHFTSAEERRATGAWWKREPVDVTEPLPCAR